MPLGHGYRYYGVKACFKNSMTAQARDVKVTTMGRRGGGGFTVCKTLCAYNCPKNCLYVYNSMDH